MEKTNNTNLNSNLNGFFLIDKPKNITSFDIIRKLRKVTGLKKMGHTGTLDPFASGLIIILLGKTTKLSNNFLKLDKEYEAILELGKISDTYDPEGKIKKITNKLNLTKNTIGKSLENFRGEIKQTPPKFSAIKIKGEKAYNLARSGKNFEIKPRKVKIHKLKITKYNWPILEIKISCSSGTYIRSLANDIGENLKTGAYLKELKRTKIGKISLEKAISLEKINNKNWQKCFYKKDFIQTKKIKY